MNHHRTPLTKKLHNDLQRQQNSDTQTELRTPDRPEQANHLQLSQHATAHQRPTQLAQTDLELTANPALQPTENNRKQPKHTKLQPQLSLQPKQLSNTNNKQSYQLTNQ